MTPDLDRDDRATLAVADRLATLARAGARPLEAWAEGDEDPATSRAALELWALLPWALEPAAPAAATRERILEQARRRTAPSVATSEVPAVVAGPLAGAARGGLDDLTWFRPVRRGEDMDRTLVRAGARGPATDEDGDTTRATRRSVLPLAMAAGLALALVGLGYLGSRVEQQSRELAAVGIALDRAEGDAAAFQARLAELEQVRERFEMITTVAQRAYPLRPVGPGAVRRAALGAGDAEPTGIVYVCGNHQRWYLNLQGLAPPPEGRRYTLWFLTDAGAVSGGPLDVRPAHDAEAEAPSMPPGTHGFAVTLEDTPSEPGTRRTPDGPYVLLGDRSVLL